MPTLIHYKNYYIYFTIKCLNEPIHIHFNVGAPKDDGKSAKIWICSDGSLLEEHLGIFGNKQYLDIYQRLLNLVANNVLKAEALWIEKKGSIEYIDIVGRFNINQND